MKTPEEQIQEAKQKQKELEEKTELTFMERRKYKKMIKEQQKAVKKLRRQEINDEKEEQRIRKTAIFALVEINGEAGNEGILDILDDNEEEMNRNKFEQKSTEWLLETWEAALEEIAKIVGNKEYENKLDFKEGHGE